MRPDMSRERQIAWGAFGGACLIGAIALLWAWSGTSELQEECAAKRSDYEAKLDPRAKTFAELITEQEEANRRLAETIEALKARIGFVVHKRFQIPPGTVQPASFFRTKLIEVRDALAKRALNPARPVVEYDRYLGFPEDGSIPDDRFAPYLLAILQLEEKAVSIALSTQSPLDKIQVTHPPPVDREKLETGPLNRPALLREYPITLRVRGSLTDVLSILYRLSVVDPGQQDPDTKDFQLSLVRLRVLSENQKERDNIQQIEVEFDLAGMEFLKPEERGTKAPVAGAAHSGGGGLSLQRFARP